MTPLPEIDDEGSEPKTAIDPGLMGNSPDGLVSEVSTGAHLPPELGDEPPTATTNASGDLIVPSMSSGSVRSDPTRPGGKAGPVIIGDANGYRGATHVGPNPVANGVPSDPGPEQTSAPQMGSMDSSLRSYPSDAGPTSMPSVDPSTTENRLPERRGRGPVPMRRSRSRMPLVLFLLLVVIVGGMGGYLLRRASRTDASIIVEVEPEGVTATIRIDNMAIPAGDAWTTEPGEHRISVEAQGYRPYVKDHTVDKDTFVKVTLVPVAAEETKPPTGGEVKEPLKGGGTGSDTSGGAEKPAEAAKFAAAFTVTPQGVELKVDGKPVPTGPNPRVDELAADQPHTWEASLSGYKSESGQIEKPSPGSTEKMITVKLEKEPPAPKETKAKDPRDREREKERERERREKEREAKEAAAAKAAAAKEAAAAKAAAAKEAADAKKAAKLAAANASKAKGKLACSASEPDAEIWIDGKNTKLITPVPIAKAIELPVGKHTVVFKLNGKQSDPQPIEIIENDVTTLRNVELK
jgi:hypothetical protein